MKTFTHIVFLFLTITSCHGQNQEPEADRVVGGPCEGCEALFEYGDKKLSAIDTLPGFQNNEPKLKITGAVYNSGGNTPAKDVILYIYHTNREGLYETRGDEQGWARRHGFIRGWVKTDASGNYTFYTFRPGAYPNGRESEHIHLTIKEPRKTAYYLNEFVFEDDPLLTAAKRKNLSSRGGSGIVKPKEENGIMVIERDIILGLNIADYR